jgi:8-oxo-dGTP diphosphatase
MSEPSQVAFEKAVRGSFRYCPHCSAPLAEGQKFGRMRRFCRYCGFIHFVEPKVAVAAVVSDGERVLLVRRAAIPRVGYWALPAGYMDADELPEDALVREIAEETGVTVRVLDLRGVAPLAGWKERRGILVLYEAEPLDRVGVSANAADAGVIAGDDVSDARWFTRDEVPWDELAFESTAEYVARWAKGQF